jgi:hypothetical protein
MKKLIILFAILSISLSSCNSYKSFVKTFNIDWTSIQLRENMNFENAWGQVLDIVATKFEMEMISKEGTYARSAWNYTIASNGKYKKTYRTRVIFKFSPDKKVLKLKVEAQAGGEGKWINGYDANILKNIKSDVSGVVGRTAY